MALYEHTFVGKQDLSDKEIDNLVKIWNSEWAAKEMGWLD